MCLFDDNDGSIDHGADGDGNPTKRHDVGIDAQQLKGNKGDEHGKGNGDDRDYGAGNVPEEDQDDQRNRQDDLQDGCGEVVD